MDTSEYNIYAICAECAILSHLADEFQALFVKVGLALWGADFEPIRPEGRRGDKKCDGYHRTNKEVFQCYAPRRMENSVLKRKIREDFEGALAAFGDGMKRSTL